MTSTQHRTPWLSLTAAALSALLLGAGWSQAQNLWPPATLVAPTDTGIPPQPSRPNLQRAWQALQNRQGTAALAALDNLETESPALADQVLMMRAQAYEVAGNREPAAQTWNQLITQYPTSPLVPRALIALNRPTEVATNFPNHPLAAPILLNLIAQQPQNFSLVRALAQYHPNTSGLTAHLRRWRQSGSLSSSDWQILADAFWEQKDYGSASRAYANAPLTAANLNRRARSHQISKEIPTAISLYQTFLTQFPRDPLMPLVRQRLASISPFATAVAVLQPLATQNLPEAPAAIQTLMNLYTRNNSPAAAQQWRDYLWQNFPSSEEAADTAWIVARTAAQKGDLTTAITVARRIAAAQTNNEEGAQLGFWAGKWLDRQGRTAEARTEYQRVLLNGPRTYHAWRSAYKLGLSVGDFQSSRSPVTVAYTPAVQPLPGVSPQIQALYESGLVGAAWERWQWETNINGPLTPVQQFVTGLLRNAAGEHLKGINQVGDLRWVADNIPEVQQLQLRQDFWQSIYPLHFYEAGLATYAQNTNLNPLLVLSLIRQESRFEANIRSSVGATGLMQVMPSTGAWIASKMGVKNYQLANPSDNLRFGVWYLDYTHRTYNNNSILAVASYNAGPGNVGKWVKQFGFGDPDEFIEKIPFAETRHYVKAVFGNYWNYSRLYNPATIATLQQANLLSQN